MSRRTRCPLCHRLVDMTVRSTAPKWYGKILCLACDLWAANQYPGQDTPIDTPGFDPADQIREEQ